jgi:6-phosphogluconolactonase
LEPTVEILPDATALAARAAELILEQSSNSNGEKFSIALSGGSTPKTLYQLLADPNQDFRGKFPWSRTHFFWTDERHVGPDDPESNYRMAQDAMLSRVPVPPENIHRVKSELKNAERAATEYETELKKSLGALPKLDLVLLGMGVDGHTASIFPGSEVLEEQHQLVLAPWVQQLNGYRLTMTLPILNNAEAVLLLVSGEEKAAMLQEVLKGPANQYPVQAITPTNGKLIWLADSAAASKFSSP